MAKEYKGISWNRQRQLWVSKITSKGIVYECGSYVDEIQAVKARDMCIISHGLGIDKLQILKPKTVEL
jgi:hypothetical protein